MSVIVTIIINICIRATKAALIQSTCLEGFVKKTKIYEQIDGTFNMHIYETSCNIFNFYAENQSCINHISVSQMAHCRDAENGQKTDSFLHPCNVSFVRHTNMVYRTVYVLGMAL